MRRRIFALCLIPTLCLSLCACGQRVSEAEAITIALEELESRTGLELTEDVAVCEKILGTYQVTIRAYELEAPVTITVDAKTGAVVEYRCEKVQKL